MGSPHNAHQVSGRGLLPYTKTNFICRPHSKKPLPARTIWPLTRKRLNRTEVNAADAVVLAAHTRVCCSPYLRCPAHTLVAMWWAAQCAAHGVRNRAGMPGPSQAIDAKQAYSQQFRASEVHTWSTYLTVWPAPVGGGRKNGRKRRICAASSLRSCC